MLEQLDALGYEMRIAHHKTVDIELPPASLWDDVPAAWSLLRPFPSVRALRRRDPSKSRMWAAHRVDWMSYSTNLVGRRRPNWTAPAEARPWPSLTCGI